ncbi:MAG: glycosyl hydrolase [Oscillospiraceae bacterium]
MLKSLSLRKLLPMLLAATLLASCAGNADSDASKAATTTVPAVSEPDTSIISDRPAYEPSADALAKYVLTNPNAGETTKKIYAYLGEMTDKGVLSAQQESTWMGSADYEMDYIFDKTGKYPAIRGLDYMSDDFDGVNERALKWWNEGGLVTICWHTGFDFNGEWNQAMKTEITDWDAVLTDGTPENVAFLAGMDKAAQALLKLQEQGVTVLWRPFHEFDGAWFWWGKGGSENFKKLWQLMYDRYTNHWGLNNLIWVLGYSGNGNNYDQWYPGDAYCDVLGADSYNGGAQERLCDLVKSVTTANKPLCFHECGTNPTVDQLKGTHWVWFMTWHTDFVTNKNTPDAFKALYNSDYVITKDELPDFRS